MSAYRFSSRRAVGPRYPNALHLGEELCCEILLHANSDADATAEIEVLSAKDEKTASIAGSVQVIARSVETALHKMHEIGFDLTQVRSGFGIAPLPPVAADDLVGIGRTNDAMLYGGEVTLATSTRLTPRSLARPW